MLWKPAQMIIWLTSTRQGFDCSSAKFTQTAGWRSPFICNINPRSIRLSNHKSRALGALDLVYSTMVLVAEWERRMYAVI